MRILLFTTAYHPLVGGSELAIENIARLMPEVHFDIITARPQAELLAIEHMGNCTVYRVGGGLPLLNFLLPKALLPLSIAWQAVKLLRHNQYDLMHAYQASQAAGAAFMVKLFKSGMPFLVTLQEGKDLTKQHPLMRLFRRFIIERADRATVISQYLKRFILSIRKDIVVDVIPNGVEVARFGQAVPESFTQELRKKLGLASSDRFLVSASRLVVKNGIENLIRSLPHIQHSSTVKLLLIGDGPLREELAGVVRELKLESRVHFLGTVPHAQLHDFVGSADIFVRPSLSEGLGNAFLEAMAAGVPVVASDVGGITDFLNHEENGLVCDPHDPASIARQIQRLLSDTALCQKLSANGRLAAQNYDWPAIARAMRTVYTEMGRTR